MKILLTGCAGFIGFHVSKILLDQGEFVVGIDNLNDYYDPLLKQARLNILLKYKNFNFIKGDIANRELITEVFAKEKPNKVVNLAAQPGVRYSITNPYAYVDSNIVGFLNLLEGARNNEVEHFLYASSSSVYGANTKMPFSVHDHTEHPVSLYAATKKANELMAHSYSHLYGLRTTGIRYFTVYGPWGRPDMSPWLFTSAILNGQPINIFNEGRMRRDFTYIDDIARGTVLALSGTPKGITLKASDSPDPSISTAPYRLYNIGNNEPEPLLDFISEIEGNLQIEAIKNYLPMQLGDVVDTFADIKEIKDDFNFVPNIGIKEGVKNWILWFNYYHKL